MDVNTLRAMAKLMERESDEPDDLRGLRARAVTWAAGEIERLRAQLQKTEQSLDAEFHNSIKLAAQLAALNIHKGTEK